MLVHNELELAEPPDEVFQRLLDLDGVAPCIPGTSLGGELTDGAREARIEVAFGPMRFTYEGTVRIAESDPVTRHAVMQASASEASGEGSADARISMQVADVGSGSRVTLETDLRVKGGVAQIGRGMIEELGQELLDEFGENLSQSVVAGAAAPTDATAPAATTPSQESPAVGGATGPPAPSPPAQSLRGGRLLLNMMRRRLRRWLRRRG